MSTHTATADHHDAHDHKPGFVERWFFSTNHKDIGTLYLLFSFLMVIVGAAMSVVIRAELAVPGLQFVSPHFFNQMTTMHALVMIFGAVMPAFVGLVWPTAGTVLTLALLAPPIFAYGPGWGIVYLVLAVVQTVVLARRGLLWAALLPGVMPFAVTWGLGLVVLPLAGALLKRWGALSGFMSAVVVMVTGGLGVWAALPFTFNPAPGAVLLAAADSVSPWPVLVEMARFLDSRPEMALQLFLFTLFSLPAYTWVGGSRQARMWGATAYLGLLFAGFVLVPVLALAVPVVLLPFLAAYVPCAIIAFLVTFLIPSERVGTL